MIRGNGKSMIDNNVEVVWNEGDLFVIPFVSTPIHHIAESDSAIYWITGSIKRKSINEFFT